MIIIFYRVDNLIGISSEHHHKPTTTTTEGAVWGVIVRGKMKVNEKNPDILNPFWIAFLL
jgi:hypothetical protein